MTAQANQDKESGATLLVKSSPASGVPTDYGPHVDEKRHSLSHKVPSQKTDEQETPPSRHLWVGNVSSVLTEAALAEQFSRFGDIESVTVYSSRNYAFVNFRTVEDAVYAKKGLQGAVLGGLTIRIEFAKGAKPCRHLWIGSICSSVSKEQLEAEFKRFGVVEDLRFLRDRNCAFVDYSKTDDAIAAYESLNRKKIGKEEIYIEYGRSQIQPKKDTRSDSQNQIDERTIPRDQGAADLQTAFSNGSKTTPEKSKGDKDGDPSEVLWIGFPIYMKVDERRLHRAFSPFGEIERITSFPGRTYAFVQFQSVKAASRAKEALQGKLFNDPRVNISFAKSEVGPVDYSRGTITFPSPSPAIVELTHMGGLSKAGSFINPRNDRFLGINTLRPNSPSFSTRSGIDIDEANGYLQGRGFEMESNLNMVGDLSRGMRPGPERGPKSEMELWGSSAMPEVAVLRSGHVALENGWNALEEDSGKRELKRQRVGGGHPGGGGLIEPVSLEVSGDRQQFHVVKAHDYLSSRFTRLSDSDAHIEEVKMSLGPTPDGWEDQEGLKRGLQGRTPLPRSTIDSLRALKDDWAIPGAHIGMAKDGWQWQGIIAKSGTSVCQARCFPVGKGIDVTFPEVVNCTARTNLDMLAKHISQAGDFGVVSFMPQGELDFGPYQDFMIYLSDKKRAAVCKLSHEATLFLVPPSEFIEQFLKVPKCNSVFGVVLKLHQLQHQSPQISAEQIGLQQSMQTQRLLSFNGFPEERYQKSTLQAPPEHQLSEFLAMPVPLNASHIVNVPSTQELITSLPPLLPQQSSLQSAGFAGTIFSQGALVSSVGGMAGTFLGKGLVGQTGSLGHAMVVDDNRLAHQPQGCPPVQQDQHSTSLIGGFSLAPTGELRSSQQEQGIALQPQMMISSSASLSSVSGEQYSITAPGHGPSLLRSNSQNLSGSIQYQQQPRPPQFPPSNMQGSQSDQLSQLTSLLARQQQPLPDTSQLLQQNMQQQQPLNSQQQQMPQQISPSTFPLFLEPFSAVGVQQQNLPAAVSQGGGQERLVEAEQPEVLQVAQQKPSAESHIKGESDEDNKRFQATLELAAALLQQLQQRAKT